MLEKFCVGLILLGGIAELLLGAYLLYLKLTWS